MGMGVGAQERPEHKDVFAFFFVTAFTVVMYAVPGEWITWLAPLRLALATSSLAMGLMVLRKLGRMEPVFLDGVRGIALICLTLLSWASVGWSVNPVVTRGMAIELFKLVAIYLTFVNVVTTPRRLAIVCGALVLASGVTSIGAIQNYQSGLDLVEGFRGHWLGVYADPNHMAMDLGIAIPLAVAFLARKETPWPVRILMAVAAALAVAAIVVSHSRGGFLGLTLAMGTWAFLEKQRRLQAIACAALLALGLVMFAPRSFWDRNETVTAIHEDASAMGRVYAWAVASRISVDQPLLGVGAGGFRYAWPLYAPAEAHQAYVAHNVYLDVIGELGFIGLLFFLVFTGGVAGAAFESSQHKEVGWLARGLAAAVAGYLLCDCFSGYILSAHFYVLFGLASAVERVARRSSAPAPVVVPALPLIPAPAWEGRSS